MKEPVRTKPCSRASLVAWLFFAIICLLPSRSLPAAEKAYVESLVASASEMGLHGERLWHVLVHYKPSVFHGHKSLVDDPRFFLSPEGKTGPKAELEATVRAFFETEAGEGDEHPRCRFPARYAWLKERLAMDESLLPAPECKGYEKYMESVNPRSAALIFPESYMNSPASMFGHTLLRIDSHYESKLVSYAINYAALTNESFGPAYAVKGLFGFYNGYYTIMPYYEKLNDYTHIENRDIWEYHLDLTEEEVRRMAMHIWEMKEMYSYYYFFDENCSYNLLFLLEAARPSLNLTDGFFYWVVPVDTVKAVKEKGLVTEAVYRPSKAKKIQHIAGLSRKEYRQRAKKIAREEMEPEEYFAGGSPSNEDRIKTLDMASEYLQFLFSRKEIDKPAYTKRFLSILTERSRLGKLHYSVPAPPLPDEGHGSSRAALGAGTLEDEEYALLRFRTAYHDVLDPDYGYTPGAAITFFDAELRLSFPDEKVFMEYFRPLSITSISPLGTFFKPVSWKVDVGFFSERPSEGERRTVFILNTGGGAAWSIYPGGLVYGMLEPVVKIAGSLEENYALGGGVSAGLLLPVTEHWKAQLGLRGAGFEFGDRHTEYSLQFNQSLRISANNSLKLNVERKKLDGRYATDINLTWNFYF